MAEIIIISIAANVVVAIIASSRNRNPIGWFFLGFLITPILSLILVLALGPAKEKTATVDPDTGLKSEPKVGESYDWKAAQKQFTKPKQKSAAEQNTPDIEERLIKLKSLKDKDLITDAEYDNRRAEILKEV